MFANVKKCQVASFFIGIAEICFMTAPVDQCKECCPRNETLDIQYKLFTRSNPTIFRFIPSNDVAGLRASGFNLNNPTVIYLMGFSESSSGISTSTVRDAFLSADDYNFIAVDWSRLIAFPWYITAVRNTRYMGRQLANFIQFLNGNGFPASSVHIVGFSLGAEAAGFAGKQLRSRGLLIGRITGLDPAYPGYSFTNNDGHLAKGDAAFVDVLHTNPVLGFPTPIGDVDFYANPGSFIQPGCWIDELFKNSEFAYISLKHFCLTLFRFQFWTQYLRVLIIQISHVITILLLHCLFMDSLLTRSFRYFMGILATLVVSVALAESSYTKLVTCVTDGCSHVRAWRLYAESLSNPYGFPATRCRDWTSASRRCSFETDGYMGIAASATLTGKMYFHTNSKPPFAKNGP